MTQGKMGDGGEGPLRCAVAETDPRSLIAGFFRV